MTESSPPHQRIRSSSSSAAAAASASPPAQEARPLHTSEIGSLTRNGTEWLGSSSGVYFVNTVRRAFNAACVDSGLNDQTFPAAEDILAGRDTPVVVVDDVISRGGGGGGGASASASGSGSGSNNSHYGGSTDEFELLLYSVLGQLPDRGVASELVLVFFKAWHPIFPFLHGPTFIQDMETLYTMDHLKVGQQQRPPSLKTKHDNNSNNNNSNNSLDVRKLITFQLVINIASLDRPDVILPVESRIKCTGDVSRVAGVLASRHDIPTIQTLLAAELYLVATMALRAASSVAGMVLRSIFQTGLHRCPLRYAQLATEDCELRKRIFWSAYALDRHLSQSLGDPITLQDSDIDVCLSGRELHKVVVVVAAGGGGGGGGDDDEEDAPVPVPPSKIINLHMPGEEDPDERSEYTISAEEEQKRRREAALTAYVQYSRLTGRVIEIFHKSIHARFPKRDAIVYLTSDIENWWNDLPDYLSGADMLQPPSQLQELQQQQNQQQLQQEQWLVPFFSLLYQQLLLLLNRPALSLDPNSAEFAHGLQVCIKASRTTLSSLKLHQARGQTMFLPALLSANWMAGLIIAFACLLGKYPKTRACSDIKTCLELLQAMNSRYNTAKQCYSVLSSLLVDIRRRKASSTGYLAIYHLDKETLNEGTSTQDTIKHAPKRRRVQQTEKSLDVASKAPRRSIHQARPHQHSAGSVYFEPLSTEAEQAASEDSLGWNGIEQPVEIGSFDTPSTFKGIIDFSQPFSNLMLPELSENDASMWGGMNFNMDDIFQSATWENLIGNTGGVSSAWEGSG